MNDIPSLSPNPEETMPATGLPAKDGGKGGKPGEAHLDDVARETITQDQTEGDTTPVVEKEIEVLTFSSLPLSVQQKIVARTPDSGDRKALLGTEKSLTKAVIGQEIEEDFEKLEKLTSLLLNSTSINWTEDEKETIGISTSEKSKLFGNEEKFDNIKRQIQNEMEKVSKSNEPPKYKIEKLKELLGKDDLYKDETLIPVSFESHKARHTEKMDKILEIVRRRNLNELNALVKELKEDPNIAKNLPENFIEIVEIYAKLRETNNLQEAVRKLVRIGEIDRALKMANEITLDQDQRLQAVGSVVLSPVMEDHPDGSSEPNLTKLEANFENIMSIVQRIGDPELRRRCTLSVLALGGRLELALEFLDPSKPRDDKVMLYRQSLDDMDPLGHGYASDILSNKVKLLIDHDVAFFLDVVVNQEATNKGKYGGLQQSWCEPICKALIRIEDFTRAREVANMIADPKLQEEMFALIPGGRGPLFQRVKNTVLGVFGYGK